MFDFYGVFATRAVDKCHLLADESVKAFAIEVVCIGSVVLEFSIADFACGDGLCALY